MTPKFRQILEIALRPNSPDTEVQAALSAVRQMVATNGLDTFLRPEGRQKTQVVYRDRVVYRDGVRDLSHEARMTLTIPPDFLHSMIERVFHRAIELGVEVDVLSCNTNNSKTTGSTVLSLRILGSDTGIKDYDTVLGEYMTLINQKTQANGSDAQASLTVKSLKKGNWFTRLFSRKK